MPKLCAKPGSLTRYGKTKVIGELLKQLFQKCTLAHTRRTGQHDRTFVAWNRRRRRPVGRRHAGGRCKRKSLDSSQERGGWQAGSRGRKKRSDATNHSNLEGFLDLNQSWMCVQVGCVLSLMSESDGERRAGFVIHQSINQSITNHEPRLLLACLLIVFLITKAAPRRERCCIHDSVTCDFSLRVGETLTKSKRRTTKVAVSSKNREELSLLHVTCESQDSKSGPMDS